MSKKIAIVQSNYIPWKGYFDLINSVDELILFDDMQYTRRDWRNRNVIKTRAGLKWLTIPIAAKGNFLQKIKDIRVSDRGWARQHWQSIVHNYAKAPHFASYRELFENLYLGSQETFLSQINYAFLTAVCKILGIDTRISWSENYSFAEWKTERLVSICKQAGATTYISGPAALEYIDETLFDRENISLKYMNYSSYPEYTQLFPPFEHGVSVIDLIFNEGPDAPKYMKSFQ